MQIFDRLAGQRRWGSMDALAHVEPFFTLSVWEFWILDTRWKMSKVKIQVECREMCLRWVKYDLLYAYAFHSPPTFSSVSCLLWLWARQPWKIKRGLPCGSWTAFSLVAWTTFSTRSPVSVFLSIFRRLRDDVCRTSASVRGECGMCWRWWLLLQDVG